MRYMFLIYSETRPEEPSPEESMATMLGHKALIEEASAKGVLLGAQPLKPTSTATTVRAGNGAYAITDGPFAETKEQLAGYYIIDCTDLDEAIGWAKKIPTQCIGGVGCVEIRPLRDFPKTL